MPGPVVAARIEKLYTITTSAANGHTFALTLPSSIDIGSNYEIALVSADLAGFKTKSYHQFKIVDKLGNIDGSLFVHSGHFSSTEDNVIAPNERIYRKFTCSDKTLTTLEFEIRKKIDNTLVPASATEGNSFMTVHIRHCVDELQNEIAESIKSSANSIHVAHTALKGVQDNILVKINELKTINGDIENKLNQLKTVSDAAEAHLGNIEGFQSDLKALQTTCNANVLLAKGSVDLGNGLLTDIKAESIAIKTAAQATTSAVNAAKSAADTNHASALAAAVNIKNAADACTTATSAVNTSVQNASTAIEGAINTAKNASDANHTAALAAAVNIKNAADDVKASCDLVKTEIVQFKTSNAVAHTNLKTSVDAITSAVNTHKAETTAMSAKIRYKLIN